MAKNKKNKKGKSFDDADISMPKIPVIPNFKIPNIPMPAIGPMPEQMEQSQDMPYIGPDGEIQIPDEIKKKLERLKGDLESFKKKCLAEYKKYVTGIALMPPRKELFDGREPEKGKMYALVLYDDASVEKLEDKFNLRKKMEKAMTDMAKAVNNELSAELMSLYELTENCYDSKWEVLKYLAVGGHVYDPQDLLAAIKVSEVHKQMVLEKFEKYIVSYVAAGSLFRGEKSNDIDVYIVVDDTDVNRMPRVELKDRLRAIILQQGFEAARITGVEKQFHVQTYILTDFWESLKDAHPVIFTLLRDGVPLFDRGVFMPWKLLLQQGRIRPSAEFIDMQMDIGEKLIERTKFKMLSVVGEDLYYAFLNPAQAALMLYGVNPPTPKETIKLLREIFVKKEGYLTEKYVQILEEVRKCYKDIEHGKMKDVKGAEIDRLLEGAKDYIKKMDEIFKKLQRKREKEKMAEVHEQASNAVRDVLVIMEGKVKGGLLAGLKGICSKGELPKRYYNVFSSLDKVYHTGYDRAKHENILKEARVLVRELTDHVQKKKMAELSKARVHIRYGDKVAELYLLGKKAFIIEEDEKKEVRKADINNDGSLRNAVRSNIGEFEKEIGQFKIGERVGIKEKTLESLKKIFGVDAEVLV